MPEDQPVSVAFEAGGVFQLQDSSLLGPEENRVGPQILAVLKNNGGPQELESGPNCDNLNGLSVTVGSCRVHAHTHTAQIVGDNRGLGCSTFQLWFPTRLPYGKRNLISHSHSRASALKEGSRATATHFLSCWPKNLGLNGAAIRYVFVDFRSRVSCNALNPLRSGPTSRCVFVGLFATSYRVKTLCRLRFVGGVGPSWANTILGLWNCRPKGPRPIWPSGFFFPKDWSHLTQTLIYSSSIDRAINDLGRRTFDNRRTIRKVTCQTNY